MSLSPSQPYVIAFASVREQPVSFKQHEPFLRGVRKRHKTVVIPYLDFEHLPEEEREAVDSYIYLPDDDDADVLLAAINKETQNGRAFPGRFYNLGTARGADLIPMVSRFEHEAAPPTIEPAQQIDCFGAGGAYFRVKPGTHKQRNLTVRWDSFNPETRLAKVSHQVFDHRLSFDIDPANLAPAQAPADVNSFFRNYLKNARVKQAVIIDGDAEMHEACRRYPGSGNDYTRPDDREVAEALAEGRDPPVHGRYVGGAQGFYFSILRFRMLFPARELHVVFDGRDEKGLGSLKCSTWPAHKKALYLENRDWVQRFARACGCHVYEIPGQSSEDQIASLSHVMTERFDYKNVLIYTTGDSLYSLASDKVELIVPKVNFRDHPITVTMSLALGKFGLLSRDVAGKEFPDPAMVERISWIKAISGNISGVPSVNTFNKEIGLVFPNVKRADYLYHVQHASSLQDLKLRLARCRAFTRFIADGQFDQNLEQVTPARHLFDDLNTLSSFRIEDDEGFGFVDAESIKSLLIENCFIKEMEYVVRNYRVIAGLW